jgi:hypothetical protein
LPFEPTFALSVSRCMALHSLRIHVLFICFDVVCVFSHVVFFFVRSFNIVSDRI